MVGSVMYFVYIALEWASVQYLLLGCLTFCRVEGGVFTPRRGILTLWAAWVATCGCAAGFTIKVVYCISQRGSENWAFQSDATSSKIVSSTQHKRFAAEVSLCDVWRGEPLSSVCCKVGQVRAVCCESVEQEELAGRPESRTRQKCCLIKAGDFYCKNCVNLQPPSHYLCIAWEAYPNIFVSVVVKL
jgi:hypothetical protein